MGELSAIPIWLCIPFAGLLLSIAVMPLFKPDWWEKHQPLAVAFWSILFIIPFTAKYGIFTMSETVLECVVNDYLTFIVLLFGLFCVAGNITIDGEFAGSPRINTALFVFGTLLSSVIGTTGSSMLLVRPFIKMNSWRKRKSHIMIFFIFLISNMGGCLTPIGDPPLLMGFMRGVPFFWSMKLFHILVFNMVILLVIFYFLDRRAYRKDIAEGRKPDIREPGTHFKIVGLHNLIYVAMIVGAVILSGTLTGMSAFQNADGTVKGLHILGEVTLGFPSIIEVVIILLAAFLSFKTTNEEVRIRNHFTWGAIQEVAVLFIGIFITMQPALMLLKSVGPNLGISEPYQMFRATGTLFSFLDNTPTYLVFLTTAGTLGLTGGITTALGQIPVLFTFRTSKEGGEKEISLEQYAQLNKAVAESGYVDLVDVEAFTGDEIVTSIISHAHANGVKVIASNHDFAKTPEKDEIVRRLRKMQTLGADIPKIALMPTCKKDVLTLLEATLEMSEQYADRPIITMSMAGTGVVSRLTGETFGSALTFGAASKASAPGQIGVHELKQVLDIIHKSL
mgnify:CR=1 FL=1